MLAKLASSGTPPSTWSSNPASVITASVGATCLATSSLNTSMRTRSRDNCSRPARPAMQAARPSASGAPFAITCVKTEEPQNAQVVFRDAARGIPDETHAPRGDVREPADIVVKFAVARDRKRIHGEVAALGIALPVSAKSDFGAPAESLNVLPQCGDLERPPAGNDREGTVLHPGGYGAKFCRLCPSGDLHRERGCGNIKIAWRIADERVPHRASNDTGLLARTIEDGKNIAQR